MLHERLHKSLADVVQLQRHFDANKCSQYFVILFLGIYSAFET